MENPQRTIYIKPTDSEVFARLSSDNDDNLSEGLAVLVRQKYPADQPKMEVEIQYLYSKEYRRDQALKGDLAPMAGKLIFFGGVPEILLDIATIGEHKSVICLHKKGTIEKYRQINGDFALMDHGHQFDSTPDLEEILKMYRAFTKEEKKLKGEIKAANAEHAKDKAEKKKREEAEREAEKTASAALEAEREKGWDDMKEWSLENGTDLLKGRIQENLNWHDLSEIEYAIDACKDIDLEDVAGKGEDTTERLNATMEELEKLHEVRASLKGKGVVCSLQLVSYVDNGRGFEEEWDNVEICIEVKNRAGGTADRHFVVSERI